MAVTPTLGHEQIWVDAMNSGDVSNADEAFAPDCVIHITGIAEPIVGLDTWKATVNGFLAAFPDLHITIDEQLSAGHTTVTRWHARATHNGPLGPLPATGRAVAFDGLIFDHLAAGKVTERWEQFDQTAILQQLGVQ